MKLSVVVPFYNELRTLPAVIDRLLAVGFDELGLETELIFVDDGSTDGGRGLLEPPPRADCRVVVHPRNRGKGAAVRSGLEAATGDILCIQDADLEYHPADLPALLEPILSGEFEVVYGNRFKGSAAGLYYSHRLANRLLNTTVNVLFNRYLQDVYTGYKVFTRGAFDGLALTARTFTVEMELTAHFLRRGLVIYEVPISYRARTYAQGKKIRFKDGFLAAGAALRYRFRPARRPLDDPSRRPAPPAGPGRPAGPTRDRPPAEEGHDQPQPSVPRPHARDAAGRRP
ncbi:MAG TPA: glycosyltransferase family 2 protein [Actinomycetes bacterium]|nr:glycosyltransferase family 2 protein [Actinomycetes bacterium]